MYVCVCADLTCVLWVRDHLLLFSLVSLFSLVIYHQSDFCLSTYCDSNLRFKKFFFILL